MAQVQCPRCGDVLPESGSACPRCAQDAARVGDATRGRIEQLADGWSLPVRDDRVGDAHIVREVRTQNDLAAAPPVRNASIGSVLSALDQEFDGDDEGVDRFEERAPTRPRDRPPLVRGSLGPGPMSEEKIRAFDARGIILSGGPASVTHATTPRAPDIVFRSGVPVLAICYGMQTMCAQLGGRVTLSDHQEFGRAFIDNR